MAILDSPLPKVTPCLRLESVAVEFPIYTHEHRGTFGLLKTLTGGVIQRGGNSQKRVVVRALDDISLDLKVGDRLGLIGHNGAGKSTLLRVMAGIYKPTFGTAVIRGHVSQLFDISLGIMMDDSGYENIYNIGIYLGLSKQEIKDRLADIADFTELGEFLDLPVRTYSTGMMTRLSFAIATSVQPDILLLDEGLGAGDARFASKVKSRVDRLVEHSSLMVLASHSDTMIEDMCNKAAILEKGKIVAMGDVKPVMAEYRKWNKSQEIKT